MVKLLVLSVTVLGVILAGRYVRDALGSIYLDDREEWDDL